MIARPAADKCKPLHLAEVKLMTAKADLKQRGSR
jgi:hypothetical protein